MSDRIVGGVISEKNLVGVLVGLLQQDDIDSATHLYEEGGRADQSGNRHHVGV